ncbi:MAG TPA: NAD(P)/FAD-dependent oxidoreductase [Myxococcota bacterium]|nr:NAD(P)/FAD-dependent oxidoreductase [Myxococcota bacterium]
MRDVRFAIIGAGMAGILSAIKLKEAGLTDFTVYEKASRLGGTWRENTYPGLGCDVPSHLYSYSFALNPNWSHRYSPGGEIQAYLERTAAEHGVLPSFRFGDEVVRCSYDRGRWRVETAGGHRDEVDIIIAATGVLHHPKVPPFEGIDSFAGSAFHSARWDHSVPLDGRRVGVIGTGSTAVQITGALSERVAKYSLFQRTAQWIMPQENPPYTAEEQRAFRDEPGLLNGFHNDLSKLFAEGFASGLVDADSPAMQAIAAACLKNLEDNVRDPELRDRLRPNYRAACKRLVISSNFYEAIQRPNAELVTAPIERIEPRGVRTADGRLHELDVLVLATGFQVDRFLRPIDVIGKGGVRLAEFWEKRPLAYLSISIPGFPNLFMLNGPNGPVGNFSLIEVAEIQFSYIAKLVDWFRTGRAREIAVSAPATEQLEAERVEAARNTIWSSGCRSWYLDDRGVPMTWPWTFDRFRAEMAAPKPEAYELS